MQKSARSLSKSHLAAAAGGLFLSVCFLSACSSTSPEETRDPETVIARRTAGPVCIDGKLNEPDWREAPRYSLLQPLNRFRNATPDVQEFFRHGVVEPGIVRLLWDEKYLYIGFELTDRDIIAENEADQQHHYRFGDTAEVFIKPLGKSWYWELYATPGNNKTVFFYHSRGLLGLPSTLPPQSPLKDFKAAACRTGTLNNSLDEDSGWTAEMAIPRDKIGLAGEPLVPSVPWLIFFGRYNFGHQLIACENSTFPLLREGNSHFPGNYARLVMKE